jgi:Asp-tRNA(Asn)/Glu-tRNA(Gln) amidotransferase A subunit family amidase
VVRLRAEEALAEARSVDEAAQRDPGSLRPLAGLRLLVKDIEDVAGMPTTYGSLLYAEAPPAERDGLVPRRLRAAGAIVVGKTNTPEFAFEAYTSNRLFGPTLNPWARAYSPGGSSGGSSVALVAGLAAIATATDGGGSIRIPAALSGIAGIKPTNGVIGREPIPDWIDLSTDGPLALTVADLALLLELETGPAIGDPSAQQHWRLAPGTKPKIAYAAARLSGSDPIDPSVDGLFRRALRAIETDLEIPVEPIDAARIFPSGVEADDWFRIGGPEHAHRLGRETIEREAVRFDPAFRRWIEAALRIPIEEHLAARRRRFRYSAELEELLAPDHVLVTPPLTVPGWSPEGVLPGRKRPGLPGWAFNTEMINLTGHPAIVLPAGQHESALPFGIQVVAPRFTEGLLLGFAEAWQQARPWPLAPPGYRPFGE